MFSSDNDNVCQRAFVSSKARTKQAMNDAIVDQLTTRDRPAGTEKKKKVSYFQTHVSQKQRLSVCSTVCTTRVRRKDDRLLPYTKKKYHRNDQTPAAPALTVDRVAEDDGLVHLQFGEERVQAVDLLPLRHKRVELGYTLHTTTIRREGEKPEGWRVRPDRCTRDHSYPPQHGVTLLYVAIKCAICPASKPVLYFCSPTFADSGNRKKASTRQHSTNAFLPLRGVAARLQVRTVTVPLLAVFQLRNRPT